MKEASDLSQLQYYKGMVSKTGRRLLPFLLMIMLALTATVNFYSLQLFGDFDSRISRYLKYQRGGCVEAHANASFSKAFYFVATIFSSVGNAVVYLLIHSTKNTRGKKK